MAKETRRIPISTGLILGALFAVLSPGSMAKSASFPKQAVHGELNGHAFEIKKCSFSPGLGFVDQPEAVWSEM